MKRFDELWAKRSEPMRRARAGINRRGGWCRRSGCGNERGKAHGRGSRDGGSYGGRVRGIALNLRFIWIGLFIAVVSKYLSTRPRPEVRSLFPPCPSSKSLSSRLSLPTIRPWTGPASTISAYDSSPSRPGCVVSGVCLSVFFFVFSLLFSIFHFFLWPWNGVAHARWLAGSRSTANRPSAHRSTARHRQSS